MSAEEDPRAARAHAWHRAALREQCDTVAAWEHGFFVRDSRHPAIWDHNGVVVVGAAEGLDAPALVAKADEILADAPHRRVVVEEVAPGERLRPGMEAAGYRCDRLLTLRHEAPLPPGEPAAAVEEVPWEATLPLQQAWHVDDFGPGQDWEGYERQAREVAAAQDLLVLGVRETGGLIADASLLRRDGAAEILHVYVRAEHRGGGLGTAVTRAAIETALAADPVDLWIVADDEDRPKELYQRLGFRPAATAHTFTRLPAPQA